VRETALDLSGNRQRIARWLNGLLGPDVQVRPDRLALRHISGGERQVDVSTFALPKDSAEDADDLLSRIEEALENDAEGLGGVQKYVLLAIAEGRAISRLPLRTAAGLVEGAGIEPLDSEPANVKGLLGQLMRHNEVQTRLLAASVGQVVTTMQRTITRLQETCELADDRRLEAVEAAERLLSRSHERAVMTQMVEDNRASKTAIFQTVKVAMPFLLHYLKKATGLQGEDTPVGKLVGQLASSLEPEQLAGLEKLLTPEQMGIVERILMVGSDEDPAGSEQAE
jgi:hypothetical protein